MSSDTLFIGIMHFLLVLNLCTDFHYYSSHDGPSEGKGSIDRPIQFDTFAFVCATGVRERAASDEKLLIKKKCMPSN